MPNRQICSYIDSNGFVKKHDRATEQALEAARARKLALATGSAGTKNITLFQEELG
ncbi:MAG: hypothetical protein HFE65_04060 [Clostridiales bacterium]|jgi:hypothetical protein|nr:hypothetical protein [Clostridiales bacterium]